MQEHKNSSQKLRPDLGPTQHPVQWIRGYLPWDKRLEYEIDHSTLSSAEVKNKWSCTSTR